jgi:hypothetical protein
MHQIQRDKVYGIRGLMDPTLSSLFTLDYRLSVEGFYRDFARQYIERGKCKLFAKSVNSILTCFLQGIWTN